MMNGKSNPVDLGNSLRSSVGGFYGDIRDDCQGQVALEAGELCGLVTQLRAPLLCYERLAELVDARADPERTRAAVCELGLPLLRRRSAHARVRLGQCVLCLQ